MVAGPSSTILIADDLIRRGKKHVPVISEAASRGKQALTYMGMVSSDQVVLDGG